MEIIYSDYSIEADLLYKIIKTNDIYVVSVFDLNTDELKYSNIFEGNIEDCIQFITIKITK